MSFQWLQMRIQEERERREAYARQLSRMPAALQEIFDVLKECIDSFTDNFGADSADVVMLPGRIRVTVREQRDGKWETVSKVEVTGVPEIPGFRIQCGELTTDVEYGILPSDKLFYRDRKLDSYLNMDEVARRILDRALFPALPEQ